MLEVQGDWIHIDSLGAIGSHIVYGCYDGTIRISKKRDGELQSAVLEGYMEEVTSVTMSEYGRNIILKSRLRKLNGTS